MFKNKAKPLTLLASTMFLFGFANAQEVVNTSGGDFSNTNGSVAYSVGQVTFKSHSNSTGSLSEGVQNPFEILIVNVKNPDVKISLSVFPNPTTDKINLKVEDFNEQKLSFQLIDLQGKTLQNEVINQNETSINMNGLPSSNYILNVIDQENNQVITYKIIKN